ncbi:phasin family protein [Sphingomonas sanxanigenens]|uniref:Phasin domain-containing protein n=1 Tax=Sphingomonas sanxanigenens DSM 19645 = NX02 TaxID=1123269 RepID=W0AJJ8_9SPHN|nr:phasin family protein [Sphingomonas sanxanigenens]AHE55845.1 hypothetical protein NX02_21020 [Sphingomonas sanxanigenens DSM 19645 = NX02]
MAKDPGKGSIDDMAEPLKAAGEAMKASGQKAAENSAALATRVIDHAEANTREAFAALRAAAQANSLPEVLELQTRYMQEQGNRSMTQVKEISEMIARFGRDSIETFKR